MPASILMLRGTPGTDGMDDLCGEIPDDDSLMKLNLFEQLLKVGQTKGGINPLADARIPAFIFYSCHEAWSWLTGAPCRLAVRRCH